MLAISGATVYTIAGRIITAGTVLIDNGKIVAVGDRVPVPHDASVIDASGKILTPGLIDCHTHLGIAEEAVGEAHMDKNEVTDPVCPHLRALDAINPEDEGLADAVAGGVTTVIVTPGSENVVGGQSVAIKTFGQIVDTMVLRHPAGVKMAFGENPIKMHSPKDRPPATRMAVAGLIRENLVAAQDYVRRGPGGDRDLRLEALAKVLAGEIPLRGHAHAADDIMTAIRIAEEFNLRLTLEHATAGHKVADAIAARGIPAAIGPSITARVKVELKDRTYRTPAILHAAGVKIALITDHPFLPINSLRLEAALAVREGLPPETAWRAITLNAAEIIGVADRVGSIEPGKDADLVIFNGDPFAIATRVEKVFVNGAPVFQAD
ncbi:MAG: amidohydrolase [Negativicutes bacterium]|nr:amidohydrolase [Negativicutes bacterium]